MKGSLIEVLSSDTQVVSTNATILFEDDCLIGIYCVCEGIAYELGIEETFSSQELEEHFGYVLANHFTFDFLTLSVRSMAFDWQQFLERLTVYFPKFVWVSGKREVIGGGEILYSFEYIPICFIDREVPFSIQFEESLRQQFPKLEKEFQPFFTNKVNDIAQNCLTILEASTAPEIEEEERTEVPQTTFPITSEEKKELIHYQENLYHEKQAKERLQLANQKLELVVEQMERNMFHSALQKLTNEDEDEEDWDKVLKIDLREYSQLLQKAKFLEHSWLINQELVTKSEKLVFSDSQVRYEREQVKKLKEKNTIKEIYVVLDECKMIESRVKKRKKSLFSRKPIVKIMKMDYNSLLNKAAYFDVLQGESYLLNQAILCEN